MNDTLDWLCTQLGIRRDILTSERREKYIVSRRRIVINFFKHFGKTNEWIGNLLCKHWSSINTAFYQTKFEEKERAKAIIEKYKRDVKNRFVKELLVESIKDFNKQEIVQEVSRHYGINYKEIFTTKRTQSVVDAKKVLYYVFKKAGMSFHAIARYLNKHHESVLIGIRRITDKQMQYADLIYDLYCSDTREDRAKKICNLLNEGKTVKEIFNITGYSKNYIREKIKKFVVKKVPNYQTSEITTKYFLK
mgnify:CR=1 FL=1